MSEHIPNDVYKRVTQICKDYKSLCERQKQIYADVIHGTSAHEEGMPHGTGVGDPTAQKAERILRLKAEIERKTTAVREAFNCLRDQTERNVIQKNLFDRIPMEYIDTPMPIVSIKRVRHRFIVDVARRLDQV